MNKSVTLRTVQDGPRCFGSYNPELSHFDKSFKPFSLV